MAFYVYIIKCFDDTYYTGFTVNISKRFSEHQNCKYPKSYTASRLPVELVYFTNFSSMEEALSREQQLKKWSVAKKEALINGKYNLLPNLAKKKFD